jgi:thioredoxin-dependent peroxiredoxin
MSRLAAYELIGFVALTAAALPACANKSLLPVGAAAPEVAGRDARGAAVTLSAETQAGRYAIVFFYPKDDTPGCTREACAFRDAFAKYGAAGVTIFGVSRDSEDSHRAFRDKYSLPFPMVADTSGAVQRAYHVPDGFPGVAKRVSFLVGPDGKIARVWPDVDPGVHAADVLAAIDALKGNGGDR